MPSFSSHQSPYHMWKTSLLFRVPRRRQTTQEYDIPKRYSSRARLWSTFGIRASALLGGHEYTHIASFLITHHARR